jgi:hypothetical protein
MTIEAATRRSKFLGLAAGLVVAFVTAPQRMIRGGRPQIVRPKSKRPAKRSTPAIFAGAIPWLASPVRH